MSDFQGCRRYVATSATNTLNTVATTAGKAGRLRMVTCVYSGTTAGTVTVVLTSGAGAGYSTQFNSFATTTVGSVSQGSYVPTTPIPFNADDVITVSAPAVTAQTSAVAVYVDHSTTN